MLDLWRGRRLIKYLEKRSGFDFQQALQELAGQAGVEISPQIQASYQAYVKKADLLETAQQLFIDKLIFDDNGLPVLRYLEARGYTADDIASMELGAYIDRHSRQISRPKATQSRRSRSLAC
jgi:DNA primase